MKLKKIDLSTKSEKISGETTKFSILLQPVKNITSKKSSQKWDPKGRPTDTISKKATDLVYVRVAYQKNIILYIEKFEAWVFGLHTHTHCKC